MKEDIVWAKQVMEKITEKMEWVSEKNREKIPYTTDEDGNYDDKSNPSYEWNMGDGINWWTNGFWGGMMWLMYQETGEERYAQIARISEKKLKKCFNLYYGLHHDVGFMFLPTAVADYKLTGNEEAKKLGMHAANLLAGRFNPVGQFIRAWNDKLGNDTRGWAIIDCMMNISLLYWASKETGDPRFMQIAMMHADTVQKYFIRQDGSSIHIGEFDLETGAFIKSYGGQGYAEGSSWSRGQAWAVYGFANSYANTGKEDYLETAKRIAHYCIANIPESGIIPVDFRQPAEPSWEDSCGACILASGLLEIARHVPELEKDMYTRAAVNILKAIAATRTDFSKGCDAIVQNCTAAYHDARHHFCMSYADYYFIEAIQKLEGKGMFLW